MRLFKDVTLTMFVPKKNKLNKFKYVKLPKPCDMFARFGFKDTPSQMFTGDQSIPSGRKVDVLADMDNYDRYMQEQEDAQSDSR